MEIWEELLSGLRKNNQKTIGLISQGHNLLVLSMWESGAHMSSWRREAHGHLNASLQGCGLGKQWLEVEHLPLGPTSSPAPMSPPATPCWSPLLHQHPVVDLEATPVFSLPCFCGCGWRAQPCKRVPGGALDGAEGGCAL